MEDTAEVQRELRSVAGHAQHRGGLLDRIDADHEERVIERLGSGPVRIDTRQQDGDPRAGGRRVDGGPTAVIRARPIAGGRRGWRTARRQRLTECGRGHRRHAHEDPVAGVDEGPRIEGDQAVGPHHQRDQERHDRPDRRATATGRRAHGPEGVQDGRDTPDAKGDHQDEERDREGGHEHPRGEDRHPTGCRDEQQGRDRKNR